MKRLQDAAYEESLAADRVKEQQRLEEEAARLEEMEAQRQEEQLKEVSMVTPAASQTGIAER